MPLCWELGLLSYKEGVLHGVQMGRAGKWGKWMGKQIGEGGIGKRDEGGK